MNNLNQGLQRSALVMRIMGWGMIVGMAAATFI